MHRQIGALNERARLEDDDRLILKIGLHAGPCLSVTLNERPDYFGSAVNLAARVQGLARGGDVVLTETIRADPQAQPLLEGRTITSESTSLKGIEGEVLVHRFVV
jgi:class 3 adenylate cyclase